MRIKHPTKENTTIEYFSPFSTETSLFVRGRTNKDKITLPEEWEQLVDLSSISIHLTPIGANQNLIINRIQGLEVHLKTNGLPVDCYYLIFADLKEETP